MKYFHRNIGPFHFGNIPEQFLFLDVGYYRFRWTYKTFRPLFSERYGIKVYEWIGPISYRRFEEKLWQLRIR